MAITTRSAKGTALTHTEMDTNFESIAEKTSDTGSVKLPVGTTAERDGTPTSGMMRFNSDDTGVEVYDGSSWSAVGGGVADNSIGADQLDVAGDGTAGQVLSSDGDGSFSWATGTLTVKDTQIFTESGTWTKPSACNLFEVILIGAGGSGSQYENNLLGGTNAHAGGGAGGGGVQVVVDASVLSATHSVTIGAGGTQNAGNGVASDGNSGGTTTFGNILTANGGSGGTQSMSAYTNTTISGGSGSTNLTSNQYNVLYTGNGGNGGGAGTTASPEEIWGTPGNYPCGRGGDGLIRISGTSYTTGSTDNPSGNSVRDTPKSTFFSGGYIKTLMGIGAETGPHFSVLRPQGLMGGIGSGSRITAGGTSTASNGFCMVIGYGDL